MRHTRRRGLRPIVERLNARCLLSGTAGLTPAQVASAYGIAGLSFKTATGARVAADGSGQTIALIEVYHDPNLASDLHTFDQRFHLPDPALQVINQSGSQSSAGWTQEEALDVEWAHAMAPGASLLVIEAAPGYSDGQSLANLMGAVAAAGTPATAASVGLPPVSVVSMSWGFAEFSGETPDDSTFTAPGITYIAASGDTSNVEYPATSPNVVAVGGTTLVLGSSGGYVSETAWSSSGGGYSQLEPEPTYQQSVQSTGRRSTPDVAFLGDPNTGAMVYMTPAVAGASGSWSSVGGTSLGAPAWAGILAIVDQGRALAGRPSLSGATQTLPTLYALAENPGNPAAFHTIIGAGSTSTQGEWNNGGWWSTPAGSLTSGASANTRTGLGTPDGSALVDGLVSSNPTASPTPTSDSALPPASTPTRSASTPTPTGTVASPTSTPTVTPRRHHRRARHRIAHHRAIVHATRHVRMKASTARPTRESLLSILHHARPKG